MYEIKLDAESRVVYYSNPPAEDAEILVEDIPFDVLDYRYVDGEFVYDPEPLPEPGPYVPTPEEQREMDVDEMMVDHEIRLSLLELGLGGEV